MALASSRPRVGYLGPPGTFSEEALLASVRPDAVEPLPLPSIQDAVAALRRGEVEFAIVPLENSLEGSITVTLDLLADTDAEVVEIVAEAVLGVSHSLIAAEQLALAQIERVLTHPQVPGQCTRFLRDELARAQVIPAASTAEAVRIVVDEGRHDQAALGTSLAAGIYGGTVLREHVEDRADNETRFVWLARRGHQSPPSPSSSSSPPPPGTTVAPDAEWKTSIVFWGAGAERAGWLVRCLDEFARRDINLTKIESRPRRERLGRYMFFADLSGRAQDPAVAEAIDGLAAMCEQVRVLGSYAAAQQAATGSDRGG